MTRTNTFVFDQYAVFEIADAGLIEVVEASPPSISGAGPAYNSYCYNDMCGNTVCVGVAEIGVSPSPPTNPLCIVNPLCGRNISCGPLATC